MLNVVVCVKAVPDPEEADQIRIDPVTKALTRGNVPLVLNPLDKNAMEAALQIKEQVGAQVVVPGVLAAHRVVDRQGIGHAVAGEAEHGLVHDHTSGTNSRCPPCLTNATASQRAGSTTRYSSTPWLL